MFEYTKSLFGRLFEHPLLASMFVIAGLFVLIGYLLQITQGQLTFPANRHSLEGIGFMGAYATFFAALGALGYAILFAVKLFSMVRDRTAAYV